MFVKPQKRNQTDKVMTNEELAKKIINHFNPKGIILEPAKGTGNFYKNFPTGDKLTPVKKDWCEIDEGKDFFRYKKKVDWIITNPPYSIYDDFLLKCFEVADNVVLLVPLAKAFKSRKIDNSIKEYGGLKEIVYAGSGSEVGFKFGSPCGCLYFKRGYKKNLIKYTRF